MYKEGSARRLKVLKVINESLSVIDNQNELTMAFFCSKDINFTVKINIREVIKYKNEFKFIQNHISKNKESIETNLINQIREYLCQFKIDTQFYIMYNLNNYKYQNMNTPFNKNADFLSKLLSLVRNDSEIDVSIPVTVFYSKKEEIYQKISGYEKEINNLNKEKDNYNGVMNYLKLKKVEKKILEVENELDDYIETNLNNYLLYFKKNFNDIKVKEDVYDELMQYGLLYSKEKEKFRILIHNYEKIIYFIESFKKEVIELNHKEYELLVNDSVKDFEVFIFNIINELKEEVINKVSDSLVNQKNVNNKEQVINKEKINSIKTKLFSKE